MDLTKQEYKRLHYAFDFGQMTYEDPGTVGATQVTLGCLQKVHRKHQREPGIEAQSA